MGVKHKKAAHPSHHHHERPDSGDAFFPDPGSGPARVKDDLAEELAMEFLGSATSGEEQGEEVLNEVLPEEEGGPFVVSTAKQELAKGTDLSNPRDAEPAAFPTAVSAAALDDENEDED